MNPKPHFKTSAQAKQKEYQEFKTLHAMEFRSELKTKAGRQCWFAVASESWELPQRRKHSSPSWNA